MRNIKDMLYCAAWVGIQAFIVAYVAYTIYLACSVYGGTNG